MDIKIRITKDYVNFFSFFLQFCWILFLNLIIYPMLIFIQGNYNIIFAALCGIVKKVKIISGT